MGTECVHVREDWKVGHLCFDDGEAGFDFGEATADVRCDGMVEVPCGSEGREGKEGEKKWQAARWGPFWVWLLRSGGMADAKDHGIAVGGWLWVRQVFSGGWV
jgi:hypothetical protein